jgi:GTP cyclohydrolase I
MDYAINTITEENEGFIKIERYNDKTTQLLTDTYQTVLNNISGEDPTREGLEKTPLRVAKAMQFLTQGYQQDPVAILKSAMFKEDYRQMVLVKDIEIFSMCEHHMLPFFGKAHVAYIPNGYITGLSKVARVVDAFSRRLQVQERLTTKIKECIQETLNPLGVAVVIEAQHMCMVMRGVQKQHSVTTTSDFSGAFEKQATRDEFIQLIKSNLR